jgi:hypothetical protein
MRRFIALLMACAFAAVLVSPAAAQASSATVVFSGPDKVKAGQTYTYTYRIEVKDVAAARIVPITASGGFELVSGGEGLMYDTIPVNTSGSSSEGTIVVRVKSSARPGDKCTLSTSGDYAAIVVKDGEYGTSEYVFSGSFIAVVTSGPAKELVETPSPTPSPTPSSTATPEPTMAPSPTPSPAITPSPTPGATPGAEASPTPDAAIATQGSAVTGPGPSDGQKPPAPIVSIVPEDAAAAPADVNKPGSISVVVIIVGVLALALMALVVVFFVRRGRFAPAGTGRDATAVSEDDSRMTRRSYRSKKRRRYRR